MSAWIDPRATRRETPFTATNPLNSFTRSRVSRTSSAPMPPPDGIRGEVIHYGTRGGVSRAQRYDSLCVNDPVGSALARALARGHGDQVASPPRYVACT